MARQNLPVNAPLFAELPIDSLLVPTTLIAHEALARIGDPMLWRFVQGARAKPDDWSRELLQRLTSACGTGRPDLWEPTVVGADNRALDTWLSSGSARLGDLLRDPEDRERTIACVPLLLHGAGRTVLAPGHDPGARRPPVAGRYRIRATCPGRHVERSHGAGVRGQRPSGGQQLGVEAARQPRLTRQPSDSSWSAAAAGLSRPARTCSLNRGQRGHHCRVREKSRSTDPALTPHPGHPLFAASSLQLAGPGQPVPVRRDRIHASGTPTSVRPLQVRTGTRHADSSFGPGGATRRTIHGRPVALPA